MAARRHKLRIGNQRPTFQVVGEWFYSDGEEVVNLFKEYGVEFYGAQEYEMHLFLARDRSHDFAARTIAISKPRQNGKSYAARFYALYMGAIEGRKVLYSAHHGATTRKMFKFVRDFIKRHKDWFNTLKPGTAGISNAEGREGLYFANGGQIEFSTRTNQGGRGDTVDVIIIDEAQELTDEQADALLPTTIASDSGDPQKIYLGTPPNEKCPGTVFRNLHDKAHAGAGGNVWWLEWAAKKLGDVHDKELWYETNCALGLRIKENVFADAADTATSIDGFFREYLGWWSPNSSAVQEPAIDLEAWKECAVGKPPKEGTCSYGVKFSTDGKRVALAVCLKPEIGAPHIEVICEKATSRGIVWLSSWLVERSKEIAQITIDGRAKADALEKKLRDAKLPKKQVVVAKTNDMIAACSMLDEAVESYTVTHFAQPGLDESVKTSPKRKIGKAGGWGFDGDDPLPIEACALAYWGAVTTKRKPGRKVRML